MGFWEIAAGLGLLTGRMVRPNNLLFLLQMAGTFLVLVVKPDIAFQSTNPLLLTTEGEFVVKDLVLKSPVPSSSAAPAVAANGATGSEKGHNE